MTGFLRKLKNKKIILSLLLIILLGFFLRTYDLGKTPAGFFCDEAATGYNAFTILHFGTDEYGTKFPFIFPSFGNNRLPIPIYFTVPFVAMFGLNEFSSRFGSALIGTFSIFLIYLVVKQIYKKSMISLTVALLLAISPWHIQHSRYGESVIYLPFFALLGILFFLKSKENKKYLIFSAVFFALGFYTYFASYLIIPLIILLLLIIFHKKVFTIKKYLIISLLFFLIFSMPIIYFFINGDALGRWNQGVSIFSNYSTIPELKNKIFYSYISHFSPNFLFITGDADFPGQPMKRHSVRGMGMLYLFEAPLILLGLFYLIKRADRKNLFILTLLLIYPLGSTFSSSLNPLSTRSILGSIVFPIISGVGFYYGYLLIKKNKIIVSIFIFSAIMLFINYIYLYFVMYNITTSGFWGWQFGPRETVKYFQIKQYKYNELFLEPMFNAPKIFFKFYAPNDCNKCLLGTPNQNYNPFKKQLFAVTPETLNLVILPYKILKKILYPDGSVAFSIIEIIK